jgi:hypothetical protein
VDTACFPVAPPLRWWNFQTPSDNELHCGYCSSVLKAQIAWMQPQLANMDAYAKAEHNPPDAPEAQQVAAKKLAEWHAQPDGG